MFSGAMLALKLGLGGIGRFIGANWKWILPILIAISVYFWVNDMISNAREEGEKVGYEAAETEFKNLVAEENRRNREFEQRLEKIVDNYGAKIVNEAMERVSKETTLKQTLRETIKNNPVYEQCVADTQVIEQRNLIRDLGPKTKEAVSAPIKGLR